jgi:hypothetical protein
MSFLRAVLSRALDTWRYPSDAAPPASDDRAAHTKPEDPPFKAERVGLHMGLAEKRCGQWSDPWIG